MIATIETAAGATIYLDGEDVTDRCYYADDEAGIVWLYRRNTNGRFYVIGTAADPDGPAIGWPYRHNPQPPIPGYGEIAREERRGHVRIVRPVQVQESATL